jgi:uncharacterized repeat protein (TIGR03847 family)
MTVELGLASHVSAETFGDPGGRTFCLRVAGASGDTAGLWMEKQQFIALSLAFGQVLSQIRHEELPHIASGYSFPESLDHEFKVGRMAVGLDASDSTIVLYTYDVVEEDESEPTLHVRLTLNQCAALRPQLEEIVSRGRPLCPLCQQPIEPSGHSCIRSNGHSAEPIPEDDHGGLEPDIGP